MENIVDKFKDNEEIKKLIAIINDDLDRRVPKEQIIQKFLNADFNELTAHGLVNDVIEYRNRQIRNAQYVKNQNNSSVSSFFGASIAFIIGFIILNGLIYFGQEIYYYNDVEKCESMEYDLKRIKTEIADIENSIETRKNKMNEIKILEQKIEQGISSDISGYNNMVDNYNSEKQKYQQYFFDYDNLINDYNNKAKKYNELAKKAYSRWWLLPFPLPAKHANF